MQIHAKMM